MYLLPEFEMPAEAEAILRHFYDIIFEEELSGWINDPATWPQQRTYQLFLEWFNVEHDSVVEDLVAGDAIVDDDEP